MLLWLGDRHKLQLLPLSVPATAVLTVAALVLVACGGSEPKRERADAKVPCVSTNPGDAATYANGDVAFGRDAGTREGGELQSDRFGGDLPWFAKTGLFVRGTGTVVVRVPSAQRDVVKILGWTGTDDNQLRAEVLVEPAPACRSDWTAYPGGLAFSGRRCVRLHVEGPGDEAGSALFGLRKDCSG
jgi:hypothetical protein